MTWVSYAQNYEDVVLGRVLADVAQGHYIDVGAQDPRMDSVTLAFYERGWRGINIEPVAHWHALLSESRPGDSNLCLAAGAGEGRARFFEVVGSGLSTMDVAFAERHRAAGFEVVERDVAVQSLDAICAEQGMRSAHFLKIDAEGAEGAVLQGISLEVLRPWVVLVEATEPNSRVSRHAEWEHLLLGRGYQFAYGDGINRYYLADEHAALAPRFGPPTVFDDFVRREQVDQAAQLESRLAGTEALSALRAREIDSLVARIGEKDGALVDWQARWHASATDAGRLLAELGQANGREAALRADAAAQETLLRAEAKEKEALLRAEAQAQASLLRAEAAAQESLLRAELDGQRQQAAANEEQWRAELAREQERVAGLRSALADAQAHASQQASALAGAEANARHMAAELATQAAELGARNAELAVQAARIAQAERELATLSRRVPDLEAELHAASQALLVGHAELMRHVGLIEDLQYEQARLLASRSWRLTRPLRALNAWAALAKSKAAGGARRLARQGALRRAAALALAPFPRLSARIKQGLYGAPGTLPPATPETVPLPLSEDAARILTMAPVRASRHDIGAG